MFVKKAKDPQTWQNAAKLSDARDAWTFTPHSVRAGGGRPGLGKDDGCDAALTGFSSANFSGDCFLLSSLLKRPYHIYYTVDPTPFVSQVCLSKWNPATSNVFRTHNCIRAAQ